MRLKASPTRAVSLVPAVGKRCASEPLHSERELRRRSEELARSNEELQRFAYVASHDLQEPLRKVRAFAGLLAREIPGSASDAAKDYMGRMVRASERMQALIDDLLLFSRVSACEPSAAEDLELEAVVRQVAEDLEYAVAETGAELRVAELPRVHADTVRLRQVMQNLLGNSLKYRRPGVAPRIEVSARALDTGSDDMRSCEVTVRDNGIGFDPRYAERVFDVFQRLHARHEYDGTGIGLAICRRIVESWGGRIVAHGRPGEGATITFTMPLARDSLPLAAPGAKAG